MEQPLFQLSQGHFKLLSLCPRKYQYTYLDQLLIPSVIAQNSQQAMLGQQFHLLMQQYWMGLDITPILEASPQLKKRFHAFQTHPPKLIQGDRLTEHRRMLKVREYLLLGVFDLLVINPDAGQIIDWKSYRKPQSSETLRHSWQTQLYLYLLVETTDLKPDQVSMTYWFAHPLSAQGSQTYSFRYSEAQHQTTHQTLNQLLNNLSQWRASLAAGQSFPQVDQSAGYCSSDRHQCPYLFRCQRSPEQLQTAALLDIESIPEIPLSSLPHSPSDQAR